MAGLHKPSSCQCGSSLLRRLFHPERWVCNKCSAIVVERPQRNPKGVCRECGILEGPNAPFKKGKNLCQKCANVYAVQWRNDHPEEWREYRNSPKQKETRKATVKRAQSKTPEVFINHLVSMLGRPKDYKYSRRYISKRKLAILNTVTITSEYANQLYKDSNGRCALTGLKMEHRRNSLKSISIDRINSDLGYVPGNVQLVCQFVNKAKGSHSNEAMWAVLCEFAESFAAEEFSGA